MRLRKWPHRSAFLVVLASHLSATACSDLLTAENFNNPDVTRLFAQPAVIEQALGSGYQGCRNRAVTTDIGPQMWVMAMESYSRLGNFNMGIRGAIPRSPVLNNKSVSHAQPVTFSAWARQARFAANAIQALDLLRESGRGFASAAQELRGRSLGFFVVGCNLAWLAMIYDSAGVVSHHMDSEEVPPLSGYNAVMSAALANMDSAIAIARLPAASETGGFPTPAQWFGGNAMSAAQFIQLVRSYKARFRAGVARSPAERNAVDWNAVIADAESGLKADLVVEVEGATGWDFRAGPQDVGFISQMGPFVWGFADVSGGYDSWLSKTLTERHEFLIVTPDLRWPS